MAQIIINISGLLGLSHNQIISQESIYYFKSYFIIILVAIIGATPIMKNILNSKKIYKFANVLKPIFLLTILTLSTSYIIDSSFNPFLYFRF